MGKIKAINNKNQEVEMFSYWCCFNDFVEILSIDSDIESLYCCNNQLISLPSGLPNKLVNLSCEYNKITRLPNLRKCKKLESVNCDLVCFETYMLGMKKVDFEFYC